jgi:exopolysaccharide biosynthesis protein
VYDYKTVTPIEPAPEGYEPFYVSHFGRHGDRYCTSEYEYLFKGFSEAGKAGLLTKEGEAFWARYKKHYEKVKDCKGNLNEVGKEQHRTIAAHLYQRFPSVFEGPTHVEAVSTESARVIMSMWSFLSSLQSLDQEIDVNADASAKYASWLQPSLQSNPYWKKDAFTSGKGAEEAFNVYFNHTVPWKEILGRFFTSESAVASPFRFLEALHAVVATAPFGDVLSEEELSAVWKGLSAHYFLEVARFAGLENERVQYAAFTLGQMMEMADADMASGSTQLRLRFGHDSGIAPLLVLLGVNGFGRETASFEESLEIFPNYNIPMGASLQLVFFRNAAGHILVKVLVNEREAVLPFAAETGSFYSWDAFKAYYGPLVEASQYKVKYADDLRTLQGTDWGWKPVNHSKVEAGHASVKVFDSMQDISVVRFPMSAHSVSVVESQGPSAAITSEIGTASKALAAINGSYFNTKTLYPVTFVKDEGKVVWSVTNDDVDRNNGMLRIKDKKGRKVDVVTISDSLSIAASAKGWREAIVSGPVLMEEGVRVNYVDDGSRSFRNFYARRHPRTFMGYTQDGWLYFIVVDGRFPGRGEGMNIEELTVLSEALGLYEALNFDGGGSATLWTRDEGVVNHPYDNLQFDHAGERVVPNVLIVK